MKIWCIADSHSYHGLLTIPEDVDMVIHAGDSTNYYGWIENQPEFEQFYEWFISLPIEYKILIAGNHDAWATKKYNIDKLKESNVFYLEHELLYMGGLRIFGSPYTPTFGEWHFMKDRGKIDRYWQAIPDDTDILVTHGPPKGILDVSINPNGFYDLCGDTALLKHSLRIKPYYHIFGHIHNFKECKNQGMREFEGVKFINASLVEDGKFGSLTSNGVIIEV